MFFQYLQRRSIQYKFTLKHLLDDDSIDFKFAHMQFTSITYLIV